MSRARITILTLTVAVLALVAAPGSRGAVPLREDDGTIVRWYLDVDGQPNVKDGKLTYYVDPRGSLDVPSGPDEVKVVRQCFETWGSVTGSAIAFVEDPSRLALKQNHLDRVNVILWEQDTIGPFTLALAFPFAQNGVMTDADLVLNDNFDWETATPGVDYHADVQAVVTHEIGHLIGLDHVPLSQSTMYYSLPLGAIHSRTLAPDDETGISALYPNHDFDHLLGAIQGRVSLSGKGDDRGVFVVALDLFTRLPIASTATVAGGQYVIERLPPGLYRVFAFPLRGTDTMVPYWSNTRTDFLGQPYGGADRNPVRPTLVRVKASYTAYGVDFDQIGESVDSNEPNDSAEQAIPIELNEVAVGLAESVDDEDWFSFQGYAGDRISVHVDSAHFGGDANVQVELFGPGLSPLARCIDIRAPIFPENRTSLEGVDTDAKLSNVELTEDGTHYVKIDFGANTNSGAHTNYYVLSLYNDHYSPDPAMSEVTIWPPAVPADGAHTAQITIVPRNFFGDLLAPGLEVEVEGQGRGSLGPVVDRGDGTYTVLVTAPTTPGPESFTVRMQAAGGGASVPDAVGIDFLGPPDPERSEFLAEPRRIPADGVSTSKITLVARDSLGALYGPGLAVAFEFADDPDGELSAVVDMGDGTYVATVTAPGEGAADEFVANAAGQPVGLTTPVHYGFSLSEVIDESLADVSLLLEAPNLERRPRRQLEKALLRLEKAKELLLAGTPREERRAIAKVSKSAGNLKRARKRSRLVLIPDLSLELAQAARQHVDEILSGILFNPPNARGEARIRKAKNTLAEGVRKLDEGSYDSALQKMARALRVAEPYR